MAIISARPDPFSDLPLAFNIHPNKMDIMPLKGDNAIKQAVKNLILTNHGEKPFQHNYGGNITAYLFENIDPIVASSVKSAIWDLLEEHEPRVEVLNVFVEADADNNRYDVTLTYKIIGVEVEADLNFYLNRIR